MEGVEGTNTSSTIEVEDEGAEVAAAASAVGGEEGMRGGEDMGEPCISPPLWRIHGLLLKRRRLVALGQMRLET